ncbi:MAG: glycosyltransferase family 2 protein [Planctomycetota bacterium]
MESGSSWDSVARLLEEGSPPYPRDAVAPRRAPGEEEDPEASVLVISYNTRELTLACLESVFARAGRARLEVIVVDNSSADGSAGAIVEGFPQVRFIESAENIGFAGANNLAATNARGEFLLLLNPDTLVLPGAVEKILSFARSNPEAGIWGGRTYFEDGSLNPASCWRRITPWSMFCRGTGLTSLFRHSSFFNPEAYGGWPRDSVRRVDIVSGCFFLIRRELWQRLGGFDREEADLCLRARRLGCRPLVTPEACIIHYGGRSEASRAGKMVRLLKARRRLMARHWSPWSYPFGCGMQRLWVLSRWVAWKILELAGRKNASERSQAYAEVWQRRAEWCWL